MLKRPPTLRSLVLEAISLGADNATRLADLFGTTRVAMSHILTDLHRAKKIALAGWIRRGTVGSPVRRWRISSAKSGTRIRKRPTRMTEDDVRTVLSMSPDHIRPEIAERVGCSVSTVQRIQTRFNAVRPGRKGSQSLRAARISGTIEERIPPWVPAEIRPKVAKKIEEDGQFLAAKWARDVMARSRLQPSAP